MIELALYAARFISDAAAMLLFGGSLVRWVLNPQDGEFDAVLRRLLLIAAFVSLAGTLLWLMVETALLVDGWPNAVSPTSLELVLGQTEFGHLWQIRLLIGAILVPVAWRGNWKTLVLLAGASLVTLADEGHGGIGTGVVGDLRLTNQALHLLAAGIWLGGLLPLALVLSPGRLGAEELRRAVGRFSGLGYGAVSVVLVTGLVNTAIFLGGVDKFFDNSWGETLLIKLGFVAITLGLAIVNRLVITPALVANWPQGRDRLRQVVYWEILSGVLVLASVAVLGTLDPPLS